jgi:hypothetical protein
MSGQRFWLGVVSAEHAARGRDGGFIQVCHGKSGPLRRMRAGDGIAIYAPGATFRGKERCQSFVSLGFLRDERVYPFDMGGGFVPHRRDVDYVSGAEPASILPLLEELELTKGKRNWGFAFRFGHLEISGVDFETIAMAMGVASSCLLPQAQGCSGENFYSRKVASEGCPAR